MAGSLALMTTKSPEKPVWICRHQWQVSYSRFIVRPQRLSTCSPFVSLPNNRRYSIRGYWIPSSSPTASLKLINSHSSDAILTVCLDENIFEEHYVSKLAYAWPQVACFSGCPPRGSRVVFVSYKDSIGEIQKFGFRFSDVTETETFIKTLKDIIRKSTEIQPLNSDFQPQISSQSEFMPANRSPSRADEVSNVLTSFQSFSSQPCSSSANRNFSPQLPSQLNYEAEQESHTEETSLDYNYGNFSSAMPPSFGSYLANCCSEVNKGAAETQKTSFEDMELKSQIAKYMEDSSFQELLIKVDKVINEIGDDLML